MNRFRKKTGNVEPEQPEQPKQSRPLRDFKDEPQTPLPSERAQRIKVIAYWALPLLVLLAIIAGGAYLAFNLSLGGKSDSAGGAESALGASADEIEIPDLVSAHLNAVGGRHALQQFRSVRYEGHVQFASDEKGFQMLLLKPDKGMLVTSPGEPQSMKLMLNGEFAWRVIERRDGSRVMEPLDEESTESLKWSLRVHNTFLRMALEGRYADLSLRDTSFEGRPCYELFKTNPDGTDFSAFLDKETLYVLKTEETTVLKDGMATFSVVYAEHRMVSGVVEPYRTKLYRNGKLENEVVIDSIQINPGVLSSLFKVPEEIKE
jgi:hypothetical protein